MIHVNQACPIHTYISPLHHCGTWLSTLLKIYFLIFRIFNFKLSTPSTSSEVECAIHCPLQRHKRSDTRTCESRNKILELCENVVTSKLKFVYWQFVWPPRPIYIMASTYLPIHAVSLLADILHRNNSPDLMRRWNAFNCGEVCIDHRIDQHIVDQIENSLKIWSTLIDLGEHCRVTIFLCFSCCSSKTLLITPPHFLIFLSRQLFSSGSGILGY